MDSISQYRIELERIEQEFEFDEPSGSPRFQLPQDVGHREVLDYANKYGIKHAIELRDALAVCKGVFKESIHLIDIGCGPALTAEVVREAGITVRSYFGIDHSPAQVWLARQINPQANFTTDLAVVPMIREPALVVMNHICAQENVSEEHLSRWVQDLVRIIPNGFHVLSIEPLMNTPKQDRFVSLLKEFGHASSVVVDRRTPGQFRYEKQTKVIKVEGSNI